MQRGDEGNFARWVQAPIRSDGDKRLVESALTRHASRAGLSPQAEEEAKN
jgi:hypothetical protein